MIRLNDLTIDPTPYESSGILVEITPYYDYIDGVKQLPAIGCKYICAFPKYGMRKLAIKVKGSQKFDLTDEFQFVKFKNLEIKAHNIEGHIQVSAAAGDIAEIKTAEAKKL